MGRGGREGGGKGGRGEGRLDYKHYKTRNV